MFHRAVLCDGLRCGAYDTLCYGVSLDVIRIPAELAGEVAAMASTDMTTGELAHAVGGHGLWPNPFQVQECSSHGHACGSHWQGIIAAAALQAPGILCYTAAAAAAITTCNLYNSWMGGSSLQFNHHRKPAKQPNGSCVVIHLMLLLRQVLLLAAPAAVGRRPLHRLL